jgi:predicted HicB family RNase H-like nuclease
MPRPKNEIPPSQITLRIDSKSVNTLRNEAKQQRITLSDLLRQKLTQ